MRFKKEREKENTTKIRNENEKQDITTNPTSIQKITKPKASSHGSDYLWVGLGNNREGVMKRFF